MTLDIEKQDILFKKIRWNYRSPTGKEFPLIYKFFNQTE
jgi:hypothetical protein